MSATSTAPRKPDIAPYGNHPDILVTEFYRLAAIATPYTQRHAAVIQDTLEDLFGVKIKPLQSQRGKQAQQLVFGS